MIPRIHWPYPRHDEAVSPLTKEGQRRPLRLTLHISGLMSLPTEEAYALKMIKDQAGTDDIEVVSTEPNEFPFIQIGEQASDRMGIPVRLIDAERPVTYTAIQQNSDQLQWEASRIAGHSYREHPDSQEALRDLIPARAHAALRRDVFVTLSPSLRRGRESLSEVNVRSPVEAAKIVGLVLRARDSYTFHIRRDVLHQSDREMFYWVLARHCLPSMWRYNDACYEGASSPDDDLPELSQSVLQRCALALQECDGIGIAFYCSPSRQSANETMYHFNYLTLLLAGALDAQARIAHRVYKPIKIREEQAWFNPSSQRGREFLKALRQRGAGQLVDFLSTPLFRSVKTLLREPRNTIHGPALPYPSSSAALHRGYTFVSLPRKLGELLCAAAKDHSSVETWGLVEESHNVISSRWGAYHHRSVLLEPYTYVSMLQGECFKLIDMIAASTDVARLLAGKSNAHLTAGPPADDGVFDDDIRNLYAALY